MCDVMTLQNPGITPGAIGSVTRFTCAKMEPPPAPLLALVCLLESEQCDRSVRAQALNLLTQMYDQVS